MKYILLGLSLLLTPWACAQVQLKAESGQLQWRSGSGDTFKPVSSSANGSQFTMAQLRAQSSALISLLPTTVTINEDGRSGTFLYDITDTTTPDDGAMCLVVGTRRYKRPLPDGRLNVAFFGAKPDDGVSDSQSFSLCVDYAIANGIGKIFVPRGTWKLTDTWKLGYGDGRFVNLEVEGVAKSHFDKSATVIDATAFGDRPAINLQGLRAGVLRNLNVIGKNTAPTAITWWTASASSYVSSGCNDTRYSPYAGISIDAYNGTKPTGGYSNDSYGRSATFDVVIENVSVERFVVGIVTNPSGNTGQSDTQRWADLGIRDCRYAFSTGTSQSRTISIEGNSIVEGGVHTVVVSTVHGDQAGSTPYMENLDAFHFYQLMNLNVGYQTTIWKNCHFEAFATLGVVAGNAPNASGLTFLNCNQHRDQYNAPASPAIYLQAIDTPVKFLGGSMFTGFYTDSDAANTYNMVASGAYLDFDAIGVFYADAGGKRLLGYGSTDQLRVIGRNAVGRVPSGQLMAISTQNYNYPERRIELHPTAQTWRYGEKSWRIKYPNFKWGHGLSSALNATGWAMSGTTKGSVVTFTSTDAGKLQAGDYLMLSVYLPGTTTEALEQVPAAIVTGKSGTTITGRLLFDDVKASQPNGVIAAVMPVAYGSKGVVVQTTSGSASATVLTVNGTAATSTNVSTYLRVGDYVQGAGFTSGTSRITAISGTTLTINETAISSTSGLIGSAFFVDEDSYLTTSTPGVASTAQSNTFVGNQFADGLGVGTTGLTSDGVAYKAAVVMPGAGAINETGGLQVTNNQAISGEKAVFSIGNYQSRNTRYGTLRPKPNLFSTSWLASSVPNFQTEESGINNMHVNVQASNLSYLNHNVYTQVLNQTATSGTQINSQSYFYLQGTSGGAAASLFDARGYVSRGQFEVGNGSIATLTDFHSAPVIDIGTKGSITTRYGLLIDWATTGITNPWGVYQLYSGVKNAMGGTLTVGTVTGNGRDALLVNGSMSSKFASGTANPTTTDVPDGYCIFWKNTSNGELRQWCNDGGTMIRSAVMNTTN